MRMLDIHCDELQAWIYGAGTPRLLKQLIDPSGGQFLQCRGQSLESV